MLEVGEKPDGVCLEGGWRGQKCVFVVQVRGGIYDPHIPSLSLDAETLEVSVYWRELSTR